MGTNIFTKTAFLPEPPVVSISTLTHDIAKEEAQVIPPISIPITIQESVDIPVLTAAVSSEDNTAPAVSSEENTVPAVSSEDNTEPAVSSEDNIVPTVSSEDNPVSIVVTINAEETLIH